METIYEQNGGNQVPGLPASAERIAELTAADRTAELSELARLTGGRLRPQLEYVPRFAGHLAVGEVAIEPILGSMRVAAVQRNEDMVHLSWKDDHGPCTPAGRYRADQVLAVRTPGPADRLFIQQKVDQAVWRRNDIPDNAARLVAAHLHLGPKSMLYRFAIDGAITDDRLFDELDAIARNRPAYKGWAEALTRYCIGREDPGPRPGWLPERNDEATIPAPPDGDGRRAIRSRNLAPLTGKYVATSTVKQLVDAAFDLGVAAARSRSSKSAMAGLARSRLRQTARRSPTPAPRTEAPRGAR